MNEKGYGFDEATEWVGELMYSDVWYYPFSCPLKGEYYGGSVFDTQATAELALKVAKLERTLQAMIDRSELT